MSQDWKEIMDLVMEYVLLCEFLGYRYLERFEEELFGISDSYEIGTDCCCSGEVVGGVHCWDDLGTTGIGRANVDEDVFL